MPSKREQLLEIMEDAAKGETTATLRARIAELEAEVERLRTLVMAQSRAIHSPEAQLAEARKALEPFVRNIGLIHPGAQDHDRLCDYGSQFNGTPTVGQARAARRALTGGQEDG